MRLTIRIDDVIGNKIKALAVPRKRSLNGQIEWMLERAIQICENYMDEEIQVTSKGGENHAGVEQGNVSRNLSVTSFQAVVGDRTSPKPLDIGKQISKQSRQKIKKSLLKGTVVHKTGWETPASKVTAEWVGEVKGDKQYTRESFEGHAHDPKTCRGYGCIQCKAAGVKNAKRGLF